jgi:hypothetical protein
MLERAKEVTRSGKYTYVEYARFADDLVILIDAYPQHDWLVPAVASCHTDRDAAIFRQHVSGSAAMAGSCSRGVWIGFEPPRRIIAEFARSTNGEPSILWPLPIDSDSPDALGSLTSTAFFGTSAAYQRAKRFGNRETTYAYSEYFRSFPRLIASATSYILACDRWRRRQVPAS